MARGLADLAMSASRTADELRLAQAKGVKGSALLVTTSIRTEIAQVSGGDSRLSGASVKGARVGAKFDVKGSANPTAIIRATGPIQLIERDTKAHTILPRASQPGRRRRRGSKGKGKALAFGGGVYASAQHPGTRGKHLFEKGWKRAAPQAPAVFQAAVRDAVRRGWGI